MLLAAVVIATLLLGAACGSDDGNAPDLDDPSRTGQELVEKYMSMLADQDADGLDDFLSDAFIRQGAEGQFATKDDYLANLPQIANYTIDEVTGQQDDDALVVRWQFTVEETVSGQALRAEPSPRLATFIWSDGDWRLLSHANFNPPAE
ncbi:MAG TPA: nuclear transport factor 2 family protein [Thermomicrobiales bacterium]|nr:nuclear transport factor 2 family protein [Thermomicrobiales bacterium]